MYDYFVIRHTKLMCHGCGCTCTCSRCQSIACTTFINLNSDILFVDDFHNLCIDSVRKILRTLGIITNLAYNILRDFSHRNHAMRITDTYTSNRIQCPSEYHIFIDNFSLLSCHRNFITPERNLSHRNAESASVFI